MSSSCAFMVDQKCLMQVGTQLLFGQGGDMKQNAMENHKIVFDGLCNSLLRLVGCYAQIMFWSPLKGGIGFPKVGS